MPVYVFETFDVIRAGRGELIEMLRERWAPYLEEEFGVRLVGVWATAGRRANWPEADGLWEMDDWEHFARAQQARYPLEDKDAYGCELARHSLPLQSGGQRALLVGAPFSPDRSRIVAEQLAGPVVLRENATALPGRLDDYLEAIEAEYLPLARARGLALVGCYTHVLRPNRALTLWSFPSWDHVRDHMESLDGDAEIGRWEERRGGLLEDVEAWLLAPPPAGVLRT